MSNDGLMLSVVLPIYNEQDLLESTVTNLVHSLRSTGMAFEVILSQNGSTDRTSEIAETLARGLGEVRVIHYPQPDYGRAMQNGFLAATGHTLVNFSIDFIDLDFMQTAMSMMGSSDIVLGSKHLVRGTDRRTPLRRVGGQVFHHLVQGLFGLPVRDTHGIKALRRARVEELVQKCRYGGALFDTELILRAHRAGLVMKEIPVHVEEVRPSRSGVTRRAIEALIGLGQLRLTLWRERRDQVSAGEGQSRNG